MTMRCTCQQAAREARKAALEEAALALEAAIRPNSMLYMEGLVLGAEIVRALANSPEKSDG